jgi:hypothetical protein
MERCWGIGEKSRCWGQPARNIGLLWPNTKLPTELFKEKYSKLQVFSRARFPPGLTIAAIVCVEIFLGASEVKSSV